LDETLPLVHLWCTDFDMWCKARCQSWGVTEEDARAYFKDHKTRWPVKHENDARGEPQPIPQSFKDALVLR
jgi:hypothetical protein